jgi:hypothetical protein
MPCSLDALLPRQPRALAHAQAKSMEGVDVPGGGGGVQVEGVSVVR